MYLLVLDIFLHFCFEILTKYIGSYFMKIIYCTIEHNNDINELDKNSLFIVYKL